jgi:PAS domain S-box-containing protein
MTKKRVFIVEDEAIVRMHLEALLEGLGWEVSGCAGSSTEALERIPAGAHPPDLLLMDIRIPDEMDGIELARHLCARFGLHSVFVTAYADDDTVRRVRLAGGLGYLVKPFTGAEVGAVLATALGQSEMLRRLRDRGRFLEAVLDSAEHAVLVLDESGRVAGLNDRAARLIGWTREEARERPVDEVLRFDRGTETFAGQARSALDIAMDPMISELDLLARDGRSIAVSIDTAPLRDAAGLPSGSFVVLRPVERRPETGAAPHPAAAPATESAADLPGPADPGASIPEARFHDLIGDSPPMRQVFEQIRALSRVDWNVLIEGETGSGKELVARALHASSPRCRGPFVAVNCAGLTESLLASQLFGHRKGAFTDAVRDQEGLFETAHGGTLFLDEIGDVSASVQKTLLRVLEEKRITRLGETRPAPWTSGSSPRRSTTSARKCARTVSGRTSCSGCVWRASCCRRSATVGKTSRSSPTGSCATRARRRASRSARSAQKPCRGSGPTRGPATSASCATRSIMRCSHAAVVPSRSRTCPRDPRTQTA